MKQVSLTTCPAQMHKNSPLVCFHPQRLVFFLLVLPFLLRCFVSSICRYGTCASFFFFAQVAQPFIVRGTLRTIAGSIFPISQHDKLRRPNGVYRPRSSSFLTSVWPELLSSNFFFPVTAAGFSFYIIFIVGVL